MESRGSREAASQDENLAYRWRSALRERREPRIFEDIMATAIVEPMSSDSAGRPLRREPILLVPYSFQTKTAKASLENSDPPVDPEPQCFTARRACALS